MHKQPILKNILTATVISLVSVCFISFTPVTLPSSSPEQNLRFEEQILRYVNAYRQSKNLPPMEMNAAISSEAVKHSTAMAGGKTPFGHDGFDDRAGSIKRQLSSAKKFAENVAYGHLDAKQVVDIWLNSPGHRRNIEGPYNVTGIGTAKRDDGTIFFTQLFAAR